MLELHLHGDYRILRLLPIVPSGKDAYKQEDWRLCSACNKIEAPWSAKSIAWILAINDRTEHFLKGRLYQTTLPMARGDHMASKNASTSQMQFCGRAPGRASRQSAYMDNGTDLTQWSAWDSQDQRYEPEAACTTSQQTSGQATTSAHASAAERALASLASLTDAELLQAFLTSLQDNQLEDNTSVRRSTQTPSEPICYEHGCNGRRFSSFENYRRHVREKDPERTVTCLLCDAKFTRKSNLMQHISQSRCRALRTLQRQDGCDGRYSA